MEKQKMIDDLNQIERLMTEDFSNEIEAIILIIDHPEAMNESFYQKKLLPLFTNVELNAFYEELVAKSFSETLNRAVALEVLKTLPPSEVSAELERIIKENTPTDLRAIADVFAKVSINRIRRENMQTLASFLNYFAQQNDLKGEFDKDVFWNFELFYPGNDSRSDAMKYLTDEEITLEDLVGDIEIAEHKRKKSGIYFFPKEFSLFEYLKIALLAFSKKRHPSEALVFYPSTTVDKADVEKLHFEQFVTAGLRSKVDIMTKEVDTLMELNFEIRQQNMRSERKIVFLRPGKKLLQKILKNPDYLSIISRIADDYLIEIQILLVDFDEISTISFSQNKMPDVYKVSENQTAIKIN